MSFSSRKFSNNSLIGLNIILVLIILLLIFLGLVVEKKNNGIKAELSGQRVVFSVSNENIISRHPTFKEIDFDTSELIKEKALRTKEILKIETNSEDSGDKSNEPIKEQPLPQETQQITPPVEKPMVIVPPVIIEDKRPAIAIVIGGLGLSKSLTLNTIKLPSQITLGFSPYANDIDKLSDEAISLGHEILINLPMEPVDYPVDDPGPMGLISDLSDDENNQRLKFILRLVKEAKGVYTIDEEKFTRSIIATRSLFNELLTIDKLFLYGVGARNSALQQLAEKEGYPLLINDAIIDQEISSEAIHEKLASLEEIAKTKGIAIGFGNPYPITTEILNEWINTLDNKGIRLVGLHELYKNQLKNIYGSEKNNQQKK